MQTLPLIPAKAGTQVFPAGCARERLDLRPVAKTWVPAFAGMSGSGEISGWS